MKTRYFQYLIFVVAAGILITPATPAHGRWDAVQDTDFILRGSALKKFFMFKIVSVDLYVAEKFKNENILNDIPKRLEVNYHVNIPKNDLYRATEEGIEKNVSGQKLKTLMPKISQINSYYPDIKAGDKITVTYIPGIGSYVQVNDQYKGIVSGEDFGKAFFSIWVGDNPVDLQAKRQLLGEGYLSVPLPQ